MWTPRHFVLEQTCRFVDDRHEVVSRPRLVDTSLDALKPADGAVAFHNVLFIESCLLELTVDVAGEHESAVLHRRRPPEQNAKAGMRTGRAIEREAVTIESPAQTRIARKACGVGDVLKRKSIVAQRRVCTLEAFRSPEVGQPGIHPHAGARSDEKAIRIANPRGRLSDCNFAFHPLPRLRCLVCWCATQVAVP